MRKLLILLTSCVSIAGCAPDIWDNPNATQEQFSQDMGYCNMVAMGAPQIQPRQLPPTYTASTTYNGTYMGTPYMGTAMGTANTQVYAQPNPNQGIEDFGAAMGNIAREKQMQRYCMTSRGYTLRAK